MSSYTWRWIATDVSYSTNSGAKADMPKSTQWARKDHSIASPALRPGLIRATPLSEGRDPSQCDVLRRFTTVN
jgi:hypothetical protein